MRFFLDHDVPRPIADVLRRHGHEVVVLQDALPVTSPDDGVFAQPANATKGPPASRLVFSSFPAYTPAVESLLDIETAVDRLQPNELEELFLFLALRLRSQGGDLPEPRDFPRERIEGWIKEDEADYRPFREPK